MSSSENRALDPMQSPVSEANNVSLPPTVRISTLPNGLRVATDLMPDVETATVGVWTSCGARNETEAENGVAHLLEHMLFKGTERRTACAIAEEIEAVGGQMNAYTARENTAYYARVLKEDVALAVDVIGDLLLNSLFDEAELARERSVVLQEIGQAADTPDDIIFDHFQAAAYPDQPIGRPVLGTPQSVAGMPRSALTGYLAAHYAPSELILSAAGAVDHDRLVDQAASLFANLNPSIPPHAPAVNYVGGDFRADDDLEQLHFLLGFPGAAIGDDDYYTQSVLSTLLGGGMSSRLFQEVREKRGLVYAIYSFTSVYRDGGVFGVYAGTGASEIEELVPVVCDQLCAVVTGVEESELSRARAQLKSGLLMSLESTMARAEQLGQHLLLFGRPITTQEIVAQIDAVDGAAVCKAAAKLFSARPTVAALGPIAQLEPFDRIAGRLG